MSDNNQTTLGQIGSFCESLILIATILFCYYPYKIYSSYRDSAICFFKEDRVWIIEQNFYIQYDDEVIRTRPGYKGPNKSKTSQITIGAEYPYLTDKKNPTRQCYFRCSTLAEAEQWAKDRGYKRALITTYSFNDTNEFGKRMPDKWFLVKRRTPDVISTLCFMVDYGDGNIWQYPYRMPLDKPGFDLNNFELFEGGRTDVRPLPWISTDHLTDSWDEHHNKGSNSKVSPEEYDR